MRYLKTAGGFMFGGTAYVVIELAWRGHSHLSMFIAGGLGFFVIMLMNRFVVKKAGYLFAAVLCSLGITIIELVTGCIVNLWLGLNVWDYSNIPLNFLGQICILYSTIWIFLSLAALKIESFLQNWLHSMQKKLQKT